MIIVSDQLISCIQDLGNRVAKKVIFFLSHFSVFGIQDLVFEIFDCLPLCFFPNW